MATWPTVTDDDGSGTTGTILDQALFNAIRDYIGAGWTSVAFNAANFQASSGSWTLTSGDQQTFTYLEIGKTMIVSLSVTTTSVSATPTTLAVVVPNGRTIASYAAGRLAIVTDNGAERDHAFWEAAGGATSISFYTNSGGSAWATSTNNTLLRGTFLFEIQ